MLWGWRRRRRRDAGLQAPLGDIPAGAEVLATAEGLYVATTVHDKPLDRLSIRPLAFRSRVTVTVTTAGVALDMPGAAARVPRGRPPSRRRARHLDHRPRRRDGRTAVHRLGRHRRRDGRQLLPVQDADPAAVLMPSPALLAPTPPRPRHPRRPDPDRNMTHDSPRLPRRTRRPRPRGRHPPHRPRLRRPRHDRRRGRLRHRHDGLPGDADRPLLRRPDRAADRPAHRQHRHERRGRGVPPHLGLGLHRARPLARRVELALGATRSTRRSPPTASWASAASTPAP